jgi:hypothetical protein
LLTPNIHWVLFKVPPSSTTQQAEAQAVDTQALPGSSDDQVALSLELKGIWKEAYDKLHKEEPELIKALEKDLRQSSNNQNQGAISLPNIVQDNIINIERSRWKVKVAGKEVMVRKEILRVVNTIVSVKEATTAAVTTEPHAALAWAGVLLLLNVRSRPISLHGSPLDSEYQALFHAVRNGSVILEQTKRMIFQSQ